MLTVVRKGLVTSAASGLTKWNPDNTLLNGDNGGVRFLVDTGSDVGFSWPGGAIYSRPATPPAPKNGDTIYNVAYKNDATNGSMTIISADAGLVTYSGGGFDLSAATSRPDAIQIPASVAADLSSTIGGQKGRYIVCAYIKTCSLANWAFSEFLNWDSANSAPLKMALGSGAGILSFSRRATGSTVTLTATINSADVGTAVLQVAMWRDTATGSTFCRVKGPNTNASNLQTSVVSDSDVAYSTDVGYFGAPSAGWASGGTQRTGFRFYRMWIENLARSGRNATAVLDADYARVLARGVFS